MRIYRHECLLLVRRAFRYCGFINHISGLKPKNWPVLDMAKYCYFLVVPIDPARMNEIFKGCRVDEERINATIDYVVPIIREMWKRTKKLPIIQSELPKNAQPKGS